MKAGQPEAAVQIPTADSLVVRLLLIWKSVNVCLRQYTNMFQIRFFFFHGSFRSKFSEVLEVHFFVILYFTVYRGHPWNPTSYRSKRLAEKMPAGCLDPFQFRSSSKAHQATQEKKKNILSWLTKYFRVILNVVLEIVQFHSTAI